MNGICPSSDQFFMQLCNICGLRFPKLNLLLLFESLFISYTNYLCILSLQYIFERVTLNYVLFNIMPMRSNNVYSV